jgi:hypothetical protein
MHLRIELAGRGRRRARHVAEGVGHAGFGAGRRQTPARDRDLAPQQVFRLEFGLEDLDRRAQIAPRLTRDRKHALAARRVAAVAEPAVAPAPRRAALAAMHAAHPPAPHRRLPAGPVVVPAARLAARRQSQIAALTVA